MIKNKELNIFVDHINNQTLTLTEIDKFGESITAEGLNEFFDLINAEVLDCFALKVYSTVYNKEKIKELENYKAPSYINAMFAGMWHSEAKDATSEDLMNSMLGFVMFGTDFVDRIRDGYKNLHFNIEELNNQVYDFLQLLSDSAKKDTFFNDITQSQTKMPDSVVMSADSDLTSLIEIRSRIQVATLVLQKVENLEEILKAEYPFIEKDHILFLDEKDIAFWNTDKTLIFKKEAPSLMADNQFELEDVFSPNPPIDENSFTEKIKSRVRGKDEHHHSVNLKTLRCNSSKKQQFKLSIILFIMILVVGTGIVAATQALKIKENNRTIKEAVGDRVISAAIDKKALTIKRVYPQTEEK